jgi:hypothetical protein
LLTGGLGVEEGGEQGGAAAGVVQPRLVPATDHLQPRPGMRAVAERACGRGQKRWSSWPQMTSTGWRMAASSVSMSGMPGRGVRPWSSRSRKEAAEPATPGSLPASQEVSTSSGAARARATRPADRASSHR